MTFDNKLVMSQVRSNRMQHVWNIGMLTEEEEEEGDMDPAGVFCDPKSFPGGVWTHAIYQRF